MGFFDIVHKTISNDPFSASYISGLSKKMLKEEKGEIKRSKKILKRLNDIDKQLKKLFALYERYDPNNPKHKRKKKKIDDLVNKIDEEIFHILKVKKELEAHWDVLKKFYYDSVARVDHAWSHIPGDLFRHHKLR
jgi:hypothetical protein